MLFIFSTLASFLVMGLQYFGQMAAGAPEGYEDELGYHALFHPPTLATQPGLSWLGSGD